MKVNKLLNIFLLPSLALLAACTQEELANENAVTTLFAGIEQPAATKTSLSGPTSGIYKTIWSENDAIGVFVGDNEASEFKLKKGDGTTRGEFQGAFKDLNGMSMSKTAVYPYEIVKGKSGSTISVSLPAEQIYKVGNIAEEAYPMVAVTDGYELNFKNICSVLKISMTGSLTVNSIVFTPNNSGIKVSGDATIDPGNTTLTMTKDAGSRVALICGGVSLSGTATDFHIVVPAQKYTGGFSVTIDTDKGKVLKTIKSDVTLKRSELYRITPFECKIDEGNKNIIFEDASFKAYMIANFDKDKDGEISYDEALSVNRIVVCTDTIASMVGIEYMTNLTYLSCNGSHVWNNATAKYDDGGILKSLDVTKNTKLQRLYCGFNELTELDVTNNTSLGLLYCDGNELRSIDISKNASLYSFKANDNLLESINVRNNPKLSFINVSGNKLTSIDVSNNPLLDNLTCESNQLTSIDVSGNSRLRALYIGSNAIASVDVSGNPELVSLYCSNMKLSSIDVSKNNKLEILGCYYNEISKIDLSNNPSLTNLYCYGNNIKELDLSYNNKLKHLDCELNSISELNLRPCPDLVNLYCRDNKIKTLKVNCCPKISILDVRNNLIETLDISGLTELQRFYCTGNPLKTLYIFSGQIDGLQGRSIPASTNIIVGSEPGEDEVFSVTPTLFDIDGSEQDITMTVTANMDYSVNSVPEWISKKSENSGTFTFTVNANTASSARSGEIIFKNVNNSLLTVTVKQGIQTYTSSDYSQDGQVTKIHSATVGKGIDVVFVGDAFADKDQDLFNKYVELGKEAFFTEEPFRSTEDRFNIYRIGSVSKNGIITQEGGDTKFSAQFGQGTNISGNDEAVFNFVQEHMPSVDLTKTIIFVIINKAQYAGTCWMYSNNMAICYVPLCRDETDYAQTLRHEGCGHGFGKLADEYFYSSQGTIPTKKIAELKQWKGFAYGFYENVDLTSDQNTILWSKFISDSRYSGKVGVYEGGYTYPYGVYRPTDNSIMRYNTGGFNAPSREAIYKKIMKFSEGDAWTYDYETFVVFDAPARSAEAVTRAAAQCAAVDKANFIPLAPPVMVMVDK